MNKQMMSLQVLMLLTGMASASAVQAEMNSWDERLLFDPPQSQLYAEAGGRIVIYDGLPGSVVEKAMSEQFERIESMMFIRTRHVQPDGEVIEDDDGC